MAEPNGQSPVEGSGSRPSDKFKNVLADLTKSPHTALEIALVIILVLSFLAIVFTWLERGFIKSDASTIADSFVDALTSTQLKVPLILFGASIMALLVLTTTRGVAVLIAVLIIGTIVAQERFLIALAHMFSGSKAPYADYWNLSYPANYGVPTPNPSIATSPPTKVEGYSSDVTISKIYEVVHDKVEQAVVEVLGTSATGDLASRVAKRAGQLLADEINRLGPVNPPHDPLKPDVEAHHATLAALVDGYADFESLNQRPSMHPLLQNR